jgi:hypothetical protein
MLSHLFKIFHVFVFAVFALQVQSQTVVYANAVENDTINNAIKDFFVQLGKAGFSDYRLATPSTFIKNGILILRTDEAEKRKIGFPPKLRHLS